MLGKRSYQNLIFVGILLLLIAVGYRLWQQGTAISFLVLAIPIVSIPVLYGLIRGFRPNGMPTVFMHKFRLRLSPVYFVLIAVGSTSLAFIWPAICLNLVDKNSLQGVLIVIVPSVMLILVAAFCVLRLVLHLFSGWLDES